MCGCASVTVAVPVPVFVSLQHVCVPMHSLAAGGVCVSVHSVTAGRAGTHSPAAEGVCVPGHNFSIAATWWALCVCVCVQTQAQHCCSGVVSVCRHTCSCAWCLRVCVHECSIVVTWLCVSMHVHTRVQHHCKGLWVCRHRGVAAGELRVHLCVCACTDTAVLGIGVCTRVQHHCIMVEHVHVCAQVQHHCEESVCVHARVAQCKVFVCLCTRTGASVQVQHHCKVSVCAASMHMHITARGLWVHPCVHVCVCLHEHISPGCWGCVCTFTCITATFVCAHTGTASL